MMHVCTERRGKLPVESLVVGSKEESWNPGLLVLEMALLIVNSLWKAQSGLKEKFWNPGIRILEVAVLYEFLSETS